MANRQQMNPILIQLEGVNDSMVANASTKNGSILSVDDADTMKGLNRSHLS